MTSRRYFEHAGPDAMLREASDVSFSHIYREIAEKLVETFERAQKCLACLKAGENIKFITLQREN